MAGWKCNHDERHLNAQSAGSAYETSCIMRRAYLKLRPITRVSHPVDSDLGIPFGLSSFILGFTSSVLSFT